LTVNLRELRARLDRLTGHVPSATTGPMMTSEQAIRECQALVEEMKAAGLVVPDTSEPMTAEEEAALVARALEEAAIELGQAVSP
jgi:hypothetical protein